MYRLIISDSDYQNTGKKQSSISMGAQMSIVRRLYSCLARTSFFLPPKLDWVYYRKQTLIMLLPVFFRVFCPYNTPLLRSCYRSPIVPPTPQGKRIARFHPCLTGSTMLRIWVSLTVCPRLRGQYQSHGFFRICTVSHKFCGLPCIVFFRAARLGS